MKTTNNSLHTAKFKVGDYVMIKNDPKDKNSNQIMKVEKILEYRGYTEYIGYTDTFYLGKIGNKDFIYTEDLLIKIEEEVLELYDL